MSTAMIEMVRVPDGKRVLVGPWDLDHIRNVMAVPMIRTYVNGKLKGGLWFDLPGPEQIAERHLVADFGFEAQEGENEIVLEIIERDRERISWERLAYFELRNDDRKTVPLRPANAERPRIFIDSKGAEQVRARWTGRPEFDALVHQLRSADLVFQTDNSQGTLELACLVYALTGDSVIGARAKGKIMELAQLLPGASVLILSSWAVRTTAESVTGFITRPRLGLFAAAFNEAIDSVDLIEGRRVSPKDLLFHAFAARLYGVSDD